MSPVGPDLVRRILTADVVRDLAVPFQDQVVVPERVLIDDVGESGRRFPGRRAPVHVVSVENQGVCAWGCPSDRTIRASDDAGDALLTALAVEGP